MAIRFPLDEELTVEPLSTAEKAWVKKLQKVLSECPDRLELLTIGDASLMVVDA